MPDARAFGRRLAVAVLVLVLAPPALATLLPAGAPGEPAVPLTYRLEGWAATGRYVGEARYGAGAAGCLVEHTDPGLPGARVRVVERAIAGDVPRLKEEPARVPGPDCLPWDPAGPSAGREGLSTPVGVRDAIVTVARPVPGTTVSAWWDASSGVLLRLVAVGPRSVETVSLVAAGGPEPSSTVSPVGSVRGTPGVAAHGMAFGLGVEDKTQLNAARRLALDPDLVMSYHWALSSSDVEAVVRRAGDLAAEAGVDVGMHWYYWADRSNRPCVERGECRGRELSAEDWLEKTRVLARGLRESLPPDRHAFVVVETEFNVATRPEDRAWWEGEFSDLMVEVARILRDEGGPRVHPATAIGAWRFEEYPWFDRVWAAYDVPGVQTSGTLSPDASPECLDGDDYRGLFLEKTLASAQALHDVTEKPLAVWDVFVASDGPGGEAEQARYFRDLRGDEARLRHANVRLVVQRALHDWVDAVPGCLGEGEKHLGLVDPRDGHVKPSFHEVALGANGEVAGARVEGESPRYASAGSPVFDNRYEQGAAWELPPGSRLRWSVSVPEDGTYRLQVRFHGGGLNVTLAGMHAARLTGEVTPAWRDAGEVSLSANRTYVLTASPLGHAATVDALELTSPRDVRTREGDSGAGPALTGIFNPPYANP